MKNKQIEKAVVSVLVAARASKKWLSRREVADKACRLLKTKSPSIHKRCGWAVTNLKKIQMLETIKGNNFELYQYSHPYDF